MRETTIVKIGGNVIDDTEALRFFLTQFSLIEGKKILVHGGGKLATRLAGQLGIEQRLVDGRRITDAETLRIVTMVYAGDINKRIVAMLQSMGCNALGLSGADADLIRSRRRESAGQDWGEVGDVESVNGEMGLRLLETVDALVVAPITHNGRGELLNTNADTIAQELAKALVTPGAKIRLLYCFEKAGVLTDVGDEASVVPHLHPLLYQQLQSEGKIFAGMLPKLDNAFAALRAGVGSVVIGKADAMRGMLMGTAGTTLTAPAER